MRKRKIYSPEHKSFVRLEHWPREKDITKLEKAIKPLLNKSKLFTFLYHKTKKLYSQVPDRKDGEKAIIHPLNTVLNLLRSGVKDEVILCCGLVHDYAEEKVDLYRDLNKIDEKSIKGIRDLDEYENYFIEKSRIQLIDFCEKNKIKISKANKIIETTKLLTRHKRDFYYRSICTIFTHGNPEIREIAIIVKLSDRMHNVLSIQCFKEQERIYQCFKNIFILNNVKKYLHLKHGKLLFASKKVTAMEKLFKKCAKATYDGFLTINHLCTAKGLEKVTPMIQLAFKKFEMETGGMWEVTKLNKKEKHLKRIFNGIIRKFDYRLHHEWKKFDKRVKMEKAFCKKFFIENKFNDEQIQAIIDYKDAYAMKEVIAYLLYLKRYSIDGFEYNKLFRGYK